MGMDREYNWIKIAENEEAISFGENGIAEFDVTVRKICIATTEKGKVAFAANCPHAGASLAVHGQLDSRGNIRCCVHNYRFNLSHGRDPFNEYFLRIFPVRIMSTGVYVGL